SDSSPSPSSELKVTFLADDQYCSPVNHMDTIAQVTLVIGVICSIVMDVGTRAGNFIMNALSLLLFLAFKDTSGQLSVSHENILAQIPLSIASALGKFKLMGNTIPYAICSCHCTYAPTYANDSKIASYPPHCTNCPTPETVCGEPLLDEHSDGQLHPKKVFLYHDFKDYLAGLLSRRDIEIMMDTACDDLAKSLHLSPPRFVMNPFEAEFLCQFTGPQPGKLFIDRGDEGRYAFALHVDFFNPEGMRQHGATVSSGIISMACLNLPLDIRYKPENLYLAGTFSFTRVSGE
ncbi:hypothetical protein M404DRAFT_134964, partial [Pisolithus tinctorius Marx 270]